MKKKHFPYILLFWFFRIFTYLNLFSVIICFRNNLFFLSPFPNINRRKANWNRWWQKICINDEYFLLYFIVRKREREKSCSNNLTHAGIAFWFLILLSFLLFFFFCICSNPRIDKAYRKASSPFLELKQTNRNKSFLIFLPRFSSLGTGKKNNAKNFQCAICNSNKTENKKLKIKRNIKNSFKTNTKKIWKRIWQRSWWFFFLFGCRNCRRTYMVVKERVVVELLSTCHCRRRLLVNKIAVLVTIVVQFIRACTAARHFPIRVNWRGTFCRTRWRRLNIAKCRICWVIRSSPESSRTIYLRHLILPVDRLR